MIDELDRMIGGLPRARRRNARLLGMWLVLRGGEVCMTITAIAEALDCCRRTATIARDDLVSCGAVEVDGKAVRVVPGLGFRGGDEGMKPDLQASRATQPADGVSERRAASASMTAKQGSPSQARGRQAGGDVNGSGVGNNDHSGSGVGNNDHSGSGVGNNDHSGSGVGNNDHSEVEPSRARAYKDSSFSFLSVSLSVRREEVLELLKTESFAALKEGKETADWVHAAPEKYLGMLERQAAQAGVEDEALRLDLIEHTIRVHAAGDRSRYRRYFDSLATFVLTAAREQAARLARGGEAPGWVRSGVSTPGANGTRTAKRRGSGTPPSRAAPPVSRGEAERLREREAEILRQAQVESE